MKKYLIFLPAFLLCACTTAAPSKFSCPQTGLMSGASSAVFFSQAVQQPTPADVSVYAKINPVQGVCTAVKNGVEIDMRLSFAARKTAAAGAADKQDLSYFIAALSPDEKILQRQSFYTTVIFDERGIGFVEEEHEILLPFAESAERYKVVVGFTLTEQQFSFNKEYHGN